MKKLLVATFVALLMVGCGEEAQNKAVQNEAKDDPSVPLLIPCEACGKEVSKKTEKCLNCGHPAPDSVVAYKKAQELAEEERRLAAIRAEEERKAKPFGGLEVLAKIKEAKESGATVLTLGRNQTKITDLSPLAGLTKLEVFRLDDNEISDISPLKGLTKLRYLYLSHNRITDISPLVGLTNLEKMYLGGNEITESQKAMLKKALPNCNISFD